MDAELISHLAKLAQLRLTDAERTRVAGDLQRIIRMVDEMSAVATEGVVPLAHPLDATQRLRPDEVTAIVDRDAFQALAPATREGHYLVPRVLE